MGQRVRLRCLNQRRDELHDWAERWINTATVASMRPRPELLKDYEGGQVALLDRDGAFQVEMCIFRGGVVIPPHTHPRMNSIETGIAGGVRFTINCRPAFEAMTDEQLMAFGLGRGLRFDSDTVHGGVVLPCGAVFLSLQHWHTGDPSSVGLDYRGQPISERQAKWLRELTS